MAHRLDHPQRLLASRPDVGLIARCRKTAAEPFQPCILARHCAIQLIDIRVLSNIPPEGSFAMPFDSRPGTSLTARRPFLQDFVDQTVVERLFRGEEVVSVAILRNLLHRFPGVLGHKSVEPFAEA